MINSSSSLLTPTRLALVCVLLALLGIAIAVRLYDLTDLPLDFHPTRQLLSELKARGMYYQAHPELPEWQRKMAIQQWKTRAEVEPEVFERAVAKLYDFTGVHTWVPRILASVFWVVGGLFLFLLVRQEFAGDAAIVAVGYFLFLPYSIIASRSFQPDVLMLMLLLCFWFLYARWIRAESWPWAILAGVVGGLAIYVKFVAAFFVIGAAVGMGIGALGSSLFRRRQLWVMMLLGALPTLSYLYYGLVQHGFLGRQFSGRFIPGLLLDPLNYLHWASMANLAAGAVPITLGVLGLILADSRQRRFFLAGLWIAYIVYGLVFDYHIGTHDYYHLPLIAVAGVSAAPVVSTFTQAAARSTGPTWSRWAILGLFFYCVLSGAWDGRGQLAAVDFRPEEQMWVEIGEKLQHGPNVVALTQDYGSRLAYWGWQNSIVWPNSGDIDYREVRGGSINLGELFAKLTTGNTYFLVTDFEELGRQPELQSRLEQYTVFAQGAGYVIYDLEHPRETE